MHVADDVRESRRRISILFIDIVGSTSLAESLDPEALRQVMDGYFAVCVAAIEEHGGVVEKFIGDAVMAAFGAKVTHEDDARRAVRAAAGSLAALRELSVELAATHQVVLEARCGISSGDAIVIVAPGGDVRILGDVTNTASRLQAAAEPGEILVEGDTATMIRGEMALERIPDLHLKGKANPVAAWRVPQPIRAGDEGIAPAETQFIGRADELEDLKHNFRRVRRQRQVSLVTVLGTPGLGKSRLVREFLATLPEGQVTVMAARCPAYGRGTTYTPLAQMLSSYPGGWPALHAELVQDVDLPEDPELSARAARSLACVMGPAAEQSGVPEPDTSTGVEEIAWAVRHLLDVISRRRPVVMLWEDLHWAAPTLLDLIDEIAAWLVDAPVLLLCAARPELLETRPSWGGGKPSALTVELGPLTEAESEALVSGLIAQQEVLAHAEDDLACRIAAQCDGNPLFAELMLDVFAEVAPGSQIPPTIHALLGARLDQIPGAERHVLEMAAVAGREFTRVEVSAMAEAHGQLSGPEADKLLSRLVRRRMLERTGPGSLRFSQSLLRDTAYSATPKARRERWHLFLAQGLGSISVQDAAPGRDDPLAFAYHMEAACLLRRELRPGDASLPELASAAADALIAEGMRALGRKDLPGAVTFLERARALLGPGDARHTPLALYISDAGIFLRDENRALAALSAAETALPDSARNRVACRVQRAVVMLRLGTAIPAVAAAEGLLTGAELAEDPGDDLGWCRLHQLEAYLDLAAERATSADTHLRQALARARALASGYEEDRLLGAICEVAQWAPVPVSDGLELCDKLVTRFAGNRALLMPVIVTRARLQALAGRLDEARAEAATAMSYAGDLHLDLADAAVLELSGFVESLAGDHRRAEEYYRHALDALRAARPSLDAQGLEADIARELLGQDRVGAASLALDRITADGPALGLRTQIMVNCLAARIAARRGDHAAALTEARAARELSESVDDLRLSAEALFSLALVQHAAGLAMAAADSAAQALEKYTAKGACLPAAQVRDWLDAHA